jgi:hypothetical protein
VERNWEIINHNKTNKLQRIKKLMKKLISLVGGIIILVSSTCSHGLKFSTNPYEYLPEGTPVYCLDLNKNGKIDTYIWDKNQNSIVEKDEIFFDLNEDGIIDCSYLEYEEWSEKQKEDEILPNVI